MTCASVGMMTQRDIPRVSLKCAWTALRLVENLRLPAVSDSSGQPTNPPTKRMNRCLVSSLRFFVPAMGLLDSPSPSPFTSERPSPKLAAALCPESSLRFFELSATGRAASSGESDSGTSCAVESFFDLCLVRKASDFCCFFVRVAVILRDVYLHGCKATFEDGSRAAKTRQFHRCRRLACSWEGSRERMSLFTSTFDPPGGAGSPGLFPKPNALAGPSRPGPVRKPNGAAQPTGKRPRDAVDGQRRPIHHARSDGKSRSKSVRPSMQQKSDAGEHRGLQKAERNLQKVVKTVHVAPKDSAGHMGNGKTKKRKLPASTGLDDRVHSKPRQELGVQMPSSMNSVAEIPLPHRLKNGTKHITGGLTDMQRGMQEKLEGARFR